MKRIFAFLLCAAMLLTFAACRSSGNTENLPPETTEEMNAVENHPTPAFEGQLTWDAINAIPVKREDMTVQEAVSSYIDSKCKQIRFTLRLSTLTVQPPYAF